MPWRVPGHAADAHRKRGVAAAARQHHDVHLGQPGQRPQRTPAQRRICAPYVVDDARQGAVEVAHHEQRPPLEMARGHLDRAAQVVRDAKPPSAGRLDHV
jgi:hypothetical protein